MGYIVDIVECEITVTDPDKAKRILQEHEWDDIFEVEDTYIQPKEWSFKWIDGIYELLVALSKVAHGYIEFRGEDNAMWKIELVNGKITELSAKIVYEEVATVSLPDKVLREKIIVNDRYIGAVVNGRTFIAYDRKNGRWIHFTYYCTIASLKLFEDLYYGRDLEDDCYVYSTDLSNITPDEMHAFVKRIAEKCPELEPIIKKALLIEVA